VQGLVKDDFPLNILHFFGRITFYKMKFSNQQNKVSLQVTQRTIGAHKKQNFQGSNKNDFF